MNTKNPKNTKINTPAPNNLSSRDFHDAHMGRHKHDQLDAKIALDITDDILKGLQDKTTQVVEWHAEPYTYETQQGVHLMIRVQNYNADVPAKNPAEYIPIFNKISADIDSGARTIWGGEDHVKGWTGKPREDEYHFYFSGLMPS